MGTRFSPANQPGYYIGVTYYTVLEERLCPRKYGKRVRLTPKNKLILQPDGTYNDADDKKITGVFLSKNWRSNAKKFLIRTDDLTLRSTQPAKQTEPNNNQSKT